MSFLYWIHLPDHDDVQHQGYIGVSIHPKQRWSSHFSAALLKKHNNPHLQHAISKYKDFIVTDILLEGSEQYCYEMENILRPISLIGWNLLPGGCGRPVGYKDSEISKEKKRQAHTGKKHSLEHCQAISLGQTGLIRKGQTKGVPKTEQHKQALRKPKSITVNMGHPISIEQRLKMSNTIKEKYKNGYKSPTLGLKRPDLTERNRNHHK